MEILITHPYAAGSDLIEIGYLGACSIDVELGTKSSGAKNDFEITMGLDVWQPAMHLGSFVISDEFSGVVDGVKINTETQNVTLHGSTIARLLDDRIIEPNSGQAYWEYSCDAHEMIYLFVTRLFGNVIVGSDTDSGFRISVKARYDSVLSALEKSLKEVGARLHYQWNGSQIVVSAVSVNSYSDVELNNDYGIEMVSELNRGYNHIIALGRGELTERTVVERWLVDGQITSAAQNEGFDTRTYLYDYSAVESDEKLIEMAEEKLLSVAGKNTLKIDLGEGFEIGDCIHVKERISGLDTTAYVVKKTITGTLYADGSSDLKINYEVGD